MAAIDRVAAYQGWPLREVPLYNVQEQKTLISILRSVVCRMTGGKQ